MKPIVPLHDLLEIAPELVYQALPNLRSTGDYNSVSPNLREDFTIIQTVLNEIFNDFAVLKARVLLHDELFSVLMGDDADEKAFLTYLAGRGLDNLKAMAIMDRIYKIRGVVGGHNV